MGTKPHLPWDVVDLVTMQAFVYEPDGSGCGRLSEIPVRSAGREAATAHQAWWSWWLKERTN